MPTECQATDSESSSRAFVDVWMVYSNKANKSNYPDRIKILSIATDDTTNGFYIRLPDNASANILIITNKCTAVITRISDGKATVSPIVGEFVAVGVDMQNIFLRTEEYVRATFYIDCPSNVNISTYKRP